MRSRFSRILATGAALAMTLSAPALAMDAAQLNERAMEAFKGVQQYTVSFDGEAQAIMNIVQGGDAGAKAELPLNGTLTGTAAFSLEPLAAAEQLSFSGIIMGQEMSGGVQAYLVSQEDGSAVMYTKTDFAGAEGEWQASKVDAENIAQMKDGFYTLRDEGVDAFIDKFANDDNTANKDQLKALAAGLAAKVTENTQVNEGVYNEDEILCNEAVSDLTGDVLYSMISDFLTAASDAGEAIDDESLSSIAALTSMLNVKFTTCYDQETGLPVSGSLDLAGSDFTALGQIFSAMTQAEDTAIDLSVSKLCLNFRADYTTPVDATVPEEALTAPVMEAGDPVDGIETVVLGLENGENAEGNVTESGAYHLEDTDFDGNVLAVDVAAPAGMEANYASESSVYFIDETIRNTVSYMVITYASADEVLTQEMDTTYLEGEDGYSDISVSETKEAVLENGNTVKYGTVSYNYDGYNMSRTYAVIPAGDMAIELEIEKMDDSFEPVEVTEEDVISYAEAVAIAG